MNLTGKLPKSFFIKTILLLAVFFFLLIFSGASDSFNKTTQNFLTNLGVESVPDTNIIIIHINENDISAVGPWPIKRSYYALLINSLKDFEVKIIGIEVFLSARFVTQAVYDNLLTKVIEQADNIVLGSTAGSINNNNGTYSTDSLSYPTPKLLNDKIKTGHLNFLDETGIKIPLKIKTLTETEKAFSLVIAGNKPSENEINLNLYSSWLKFRNYSLLEYFDLLQNNKDSLFFLKNKIIIIGISDPQLSESISSAFDEQVPGVALHAFAVDNILNDRWFCNNHYSFSAIVFLLFLITLSFFTQKRPVEKIIAIYISLLILFLLISFIYLKVFYIKLAYANFIIPLLFLFITELIFYTRERQEILLGTIAETQALKSVLKNKESHLEKLQKELDVTETGSEKLVEKIKSLKDDISRMKKSEEDQTAVEIDSESKKENFFGIVYRSKAMANIVDLIKITAPEDANILILGESGTGKELAAKAIHSLSKRKDKNFIAVNCGALSDNLLESELFGHVKGAFTGAVADKVGRFEAADNGAIFLDEIAETSENFQVKLLRILQSGEFEKVGSSKTQRVNVRIVAATNKKLEEAVNEKKFREDLYYRLNVIKIELPPLRNRKEDVEVLAEHFVKNESPDLKISISVLKTLREYNWKGNVRELEAVIRRASIFAKSSGRKLLQLSDLPKELVKDTSIDFEDLVFESLRNKKFSYSSVTETAKELGKVNRTLVAENFRGVALKTLVENNYDVNLSIREISDTDEPEVNERVKNKVETFLQNIENDVKNLSGNDLETVKSNLSSKYKNLPQRFHIYLDEVIKHFLR
ncbi:MAG: sigma 54-interacting transcriptional regulator [Ignavibacteria bacterium]|nr:sigma 54-interacting transcriptional regulator [Ignavibacteria bacterium]